MNETPEYFTSNLDVFLDKESTVHKILIVKKTTIKETVDEIFEILKEEKDLIIVGIKKNVPKAITIAEIVTRNETSIHQITELVSSSQLDEEDRKIICKKPQDDYLLIIRLFKPNKTPIVTTKSSPLNNIVRNFGGKIKKRENKNKNNNQNLGVSPISKQTLKNMSRPAAKGFDRRKSLSKSKFKELDLSEIYKSSIKLGTANKINTGNAWNLQLIEVMKNVMNVDDVHLVDKENSENHDSVSLRRNKQKENEDSPRLCNFQVASNTLDTSVKIYAARVDNLHTTTYKVLSGLTRESNSLEEENAHQMEQGSEEMDEDGVPIPNNNSNNSAERAKEIERNLREEKRMKNRSNNISHTLESNLSNINSKKFEMEYVIDPLFHKNSAAFDEGGAHGLLLGKLGVSEGCNIIFDSTEYDPEKIDTKTVEIYSFDNLTEYLPSNQFWDATEICPVFNDFTFEWDPSSSRILNNNHCSLLEFSVNKSKMNSDQKTIEQKMFENSPAENNQDLDLFVNNQFDDDDDDANDYEGIYDHFGGDQPIDNGNILNQSLNSSVQFTTHNSDDDKIIQSKMASNNTNNNNNNNNIGMSKDGDSQELRKNFIDVFLEGPSQFSKGTDFSRVLSDQVDEFSYFNTQNIDNWAGPDHWRFKPSSKIKQISTQTNNKTKQKRGEFFIDFFGDDETDYEALFKKPAKGGSTSLTSQSLMTSPSTLLPVDVHYELKSLLQLFCKPGKFVYNYKRNGNGEDNTARMTEVIPIIQSLDLPANDRSGHFDNEGGDFMIGTKLEDGPAAANSFHLDDDNVCSSTQWNDDPHDDGDDVPEGWEGPQESFANIAPFANIPLTHQLGETDLIDAPRQVDKITISYAKRANRIDIELLKNSIWSGVAESAKLSNEAKTVAKVVNPKNFTSILQSLPKSLPKNQLEDLSVPLCFICLLELANKKGLQIEAKGKELVINDYQFCDR